MRTLLAGAHAPSTLCCGLLKQGTPDEGSQRHEAHLQTAKKTAPLVAGSASFARKSSAAAGNVLLSRGSITGCFLRAIRSHML